MQQSRTTRATVPLTVKIISTLFVAVLVPIYWNAYGLLHFLWISDIALFLTLAALWRESPFLNSVVVLGALPFETVWMLDFIGQLLGLPSFGVAGYMFESDESLLMRGLSLFHVPLPVIWVWLLVRWGYDRRAFKIVLPGFLALVLVTHGLTDPEDNINWLFSPRVEGWTWISQPLWVVFYLVAVPLLWFGPAHALLKRFSPLG